jgi:hypothetical protein
MIQNRDNFSEIKMGQTVNKSEVDLVRMTVRTQWVNNDQTYINGIQNYLRREPWEGMDWIDHAQDRDQWRVLVNTVMNPRVP